MRRKKKFLIQIKNFFYLNKKEFLVKKNVKNAIYKVYAKNVNKILKLIYHHHVNVYQLILIMVIHFVNYVIIHANNAALSMNAGLVKGIK